MALGPETRLQGNTLYVNESELKDALLPNPYIEDIRVDVARPGESVRIANALDVVEPRVKKSGPGVMFPGRQSPTWERNTRTDERL